METKLVKKSPLYQKYDQPNTLEVLMYSNMGPQIKGHCPKHNNPYLYTHTKWYWNKKKPFLNGKTMIKLTQKVQ